jgi:hypothetical protein
VVQATIGISSAVGTTSRIATDIVIGARDQAELASKGISNPGHHFIVTGNSAVMMVRDRGSQAAKDIGTRVLVQIDMAARAIDKGVHPAVVTGRATAISADGTNSRIAMEIVNSVDNRIDRVMDANILAPRSIAVATAARILADEVNPRAGKDAEASGPNYTVTVTGITVIPVCRIPGMVVVTVISAGGMNLRAATDIAVSVPGPTGKATKITDIPVRRDMGMGMGIGMGSMMSVDDKNSRAVRQTVASDISRTGLTMGTMDT